MEPHKIITRFEGGMSFTATINQHRVIMDVPADEGGSDSAPSPKRMLLASLAGCTGMDVVTILNKMKVKFSDFSIETEAKVAETYPKIYTEVKITYFIRIKESDRSKMEKAVTLSKTKYCSVSAMFGSFAKISTEIRYLGR